MRLNLRASESGIMSTTGNLGGGDVTAPTLSSPTGTQTGSTTGSSTVTTNEANGTLYAFLSTSATPPSAANLKTGTGAVTSSSQTITTTGVKSVNWTGLTASTTYYTHWLHRDAAGNDSSIVSGAGFTTAAAGATTVWSAVSPNKSPSLTVSGSPALHVVGTTAANVTALVRSTAAATGKKRFEVTVTTLSSGIFIGVDDGTINFNSTTTKPGSGNASGVLCFANGAYAEIDSSTSSVQTPSTFIATGDVLACEFDTTANTVAFFRVRSGTPTQIGTTVTITGLTSWYAFTGSNNNAVPVDVTDANFGQSAFASTPTTGFTAFG